MATQMTAERPPIGGRSTLSGDDVSTLTLLIRYLGLAAFDGMALIIIYAFFSDDNAGFAFVFIVITLFANVVVLVPSLFPIKWMAPGLMLMTLFVVYPVIYTVITALTNYGDGHLLTKTQAIAQLEENRKNRYVPDDAQTYAWDVYQNDSGDYALWLTGEDAEGNPTAAFAPVNASIEDIESPPDELPETYEGYRLLSAGERAQALNSIQDIVFGDDEDSAAIRSRRQAARPLEQRYLYDSELQIIHDRQTDTIFRVDNETGEFVQEGGGEEVPIGPSGFRVNVGLENFRKLYEDRTLLEPLFDIFVWTITFSLLSVVTTFFFGLSMALVVDHPFVPLQKFWRSLIFIPYTLPGVISVLLWQGMLNQNIGIITNTYFDLFGYRIPWFTDPWAAKVAILLVNLWLGYPYMMLICSGALKAIPSEVYEAAAVDGARPGQTFWRITLPLLLVSVGPLLVASFTYNFNNYLLIDLLTGGDPPIPGTSTPAGYTDILINYTYNLAFGASEGADYGYASAITIVIFAIVGAITLFNFRFVARWEEVGENV